MSIRKAFLILMSVAMVAGLTGCMSAGDESITATTAPTQQPVVTAEATAPASTFDWNSGSKDVEAALEQLSEIGNARVAIAGRTALVGVTFDDAYKGQLTERIRDMIAGVVKKADPSIERVAVTAAEDDVAKIFEFTDSIRADATKTFDNFKNDIERIINNATTM